MLPRDLARKVSTDEGGLSQSPPEPPACSREQGGRPLPPRTGQEHLFELAEVLWPI